MKIRTILAVFALAARIHAQTTFNSVDIRPLASTASFLRLWNSANTVSASLSFTSGFVTINRPVSLTSNTLDVPGLVMNQTATVSGIAAPNYIQFPQIGATAYGTVGQIGNAEMNMTFNMLYLGATVHHYGADSTQNAFWWSLGDYGAKLQCGDKNQALNVDIENPWTCFIVDHNGVATTRGLINNTNLALFNGPVTFANATNWISGVNGLSLGNGNLGAAFTAAQNIDCDTYSGVRCTIQLTTRGSGGNQENWRTSNGSQPVPTASVNNDGVMAIYGYGYDGSAYVNGMLDNTYVSGAVSAGVVPMTRDLSMNGVVTARWTASNLKIFGTLNVQNAIQANGVAGFSGTYNLRDSAGTGACSATYSYGLLTSTTC